MLPNPASSYSLVSKLIYLPVNRRSETLMVHQGGGNTYWLGQPIWWLRSRDITLARWNFTASRGVARWNFTAKISQGPISTGHANLLCIVPILIYLLPEQARFNCTHTLTVVRIYFYIVFNLWSLSTYCKQMVFFLSKGCGEHLIDTNCISINP